MRSVSRLLLASKPAKPAKREPKRNVQLSEDQAVCLLAELASARWIGKREELVVKYGTTERSLCRWLERARARDDLAARVADEKEKLQERWRSQLAETARDLLEGLSDFAAKVKAKPKPEAGDGRELAGGFKIVVEAMALCSMIPNGQQPRNPRKDTSAAAPAGADARGASRAPPNDGGAARAGDGSDTAFPAGNPVH
ncbi:MAG: hypothetical protein H0U56_15575 [Methylibium sp.]|nr:hypothetical protein [Methylibium sp.]